MTPGQVRNDFENSIFAHYALVFPSELSTDGLDIPEDDRREGLLQMEPLDVVTPVVALI